MAKIGAGENIVKAIRIVSETHSQVSMLIGALDKAFGSGDWRKLRDEDWIGGTQTGFKANSPTYWLAESLHRAYVPESARKGGVRSALIIEIHLAPAKWDVPIISAVGIKLGETCSEKEFFRSWRWGDCWDWKARVLANVKFGVPSKLDPAVLSDVLPPVRAATALFLPLCELSKDNLEDMFVAKVGSIIKDS